MSNNKFSGNKTNPSHHYLNTQKSNAHTKINKQLVQLWFGSAAAPPDLVDSSSFKAFNNKCFSTIQQHLMELLKPLDSNNVKSIAIAILGLSMSNIASAASWPASPVTGSGDGGECVLTHHQNVGVNATPNSFYNISDHTNPNTLTIIGPWGVPSGTVEGLTADVASKDFYALNANRSGKLWLGELDPVAGSFADITSTGHASLSHSVYGSLSIFQSRAIAHQPGTNELWVAAYNAHPASGPGVTNVYLFKMSTITGEVLTGAFGGEDYIAVDLAPYTFNSSNDRPTVEALTFYKNEPNILYGVLSTLSGGNPKVGHLFAVDVSQATPEAVLAPKNLSGVSYTSGAAPSSDYYDIEGMSFDEDGDLVMISSNVGGTNANSLITVDLATGEASNKRTIISGDWEGIVCDPLFPINGVGTVSGSVKDGTGAAIANVTVNLKDSTGAIYATETTNPSGAYEFTNVPVGEYTIEETDLANYSSVSDAQSADGDTTANTDTNDNSIPVTVTSGEADTGNDFVDIPAPIVGSVAGSVKDDTGAALESVTVKLKDSSGAVIATETTDPSGNYTFTNVPVGEYTVEETDPANYSSVSDSQSSDGDTTANADTNDNSIPVTVTSGETDTANDFVDTPDTGVVSGSVKDNTGAAIEGVTVKLKDNSGAVIATETTDPSGNYTFTSVPAGEYTVEETDPANFSSTSDTQSSDGDTTANTDTNDNSIPVTVAPGETDSNNDFVDTSNAGIVNGSVKDPSGNPIVGAKVKLVNTDGSPVTGTDGNLIAEVTVNPSTGAYEFTNVPVGDYKLVETNPANYTSTNESSDQTGDPANTSTTDDEIPITVTANETDSGNDFIDTPDGSVVSGTVKDSAGNAIESVTVELKDSGGAVVDTVTTGSSGAYSFTNVPAGEYTIVETDPTNFHSVSDTQSADGDTTANTNTNDNIIPVTVALGETDPNNDFVDDPDTGDVSGSVKDSTGAAIKNVTVELKDASGTVVATETTNNSGNYTFSSIPVGEYTIVETDPADFHSVSDAQSADGDTTPNTDTNDNSIPVTVTANETDTANDFVDTPDTGDVSGSVKDTAGNPLQSVTVELKDSTGAVIDTQTTDGSGNYTFSDVPVGEYTIEETDPANVQSVSDTQSTDDDTTPNTDTNDNSIPVTVTANETDSGNDFVDSPHVTVSGKVFDDANGGNVDGTGLGNPDGTTLYAHLIIEFGTANENVLQEVTVNADGTYSFSNVPANTTYDVLISSTQGTVGSTKPAVTLPTDWATTAEGIAGVDDTNPNSVTIVTVGTSDVINVLFGINKKPTATDVTASSQPNPGGTTQVQVPTLSIADAEDGTPTTVIIKTLPDATTEGVLYYNNNPVSAGAEIANFDPTKLTLDPIDGTVTVDFDYSTKDAAGVESDTATVTMPFGGISLSGQVFQDTDGGNVDGTGLGNPDSTTLYANLIDSSGNVVATTTVNADGTYNIANVTPNTTYNVQISTAQGTVSNAQPATTLPTNWIATGEGITGTPDSTVDGVTQVAVGSTSVTDVLFGIDKISAPVAVDDSKTNLNPATPTNPTIVPTVGNDTDPDGNLDPTTVKLVDPSGNPVTTLTVPNEGQWVVNTTNGEVTFTPEAGFTDDPTPVKYTVKDTGGLESNEATITVDYPQTAPVAVDDTKTNPNPATPSNPTTLTTVSNDTDPENDLDPTSVKLVDGTGNPVSTLNVPNEGTWTVDATSGDITFTPEAGFTADPTPVKYTVKDVNGLESNQATETVDYPQSDPVAVDDSATNPNPATPSNPTTLTTVSNDTDPENDLDPTSVKLVDGTGNPVTTLVVTNEGTWTVDATSGDITFTPEAGFTADPTPVKYTVKDKNGLVSNEATETVDYPQTAPTATDDTESGTTGTPTTVDVIPNDTDPENDLDPTTVKLVDPSGNPVTSLNVPNEGDWTVNPTTGEVTFTPETGFTDDPTPVKYTVKDTGDIESNQATVTIDYPQSNPVAVDDTETNPNTASPTNPTTLTTVSNDTDPENDLDPTSVKLVDGTGNPVTTLAVTGEGTWTVDATSGDITFTPEADFTADPTPVKYTVKDQNGLLSNEATETVDYPQTAPVATDDTQSGITATPTTVDVIPNDSDPENDLDPTTVKLVDPSGNPVTTLNVPNEGDWTVNPTTGEVTFAPETGFTADPTPVKYTVKDTGGIESNQATVTIDYPQTAPVAVDDTKSNANPATPSNPTTLATVSNDTDPENDLDPTTVKLVDPTGNPVTTLTVPNEGTWTVDATSGDITFTPEAGFTSDPTPVKYTVKDQGGIESNQATVTVDYPQTAPIAVDDSATNPNTASPTNPTTVITVDNDTDPENDLDPATVKLVDPSGNPVTTLTVPNEGEWVVDPTTGAVTFTPAAGFTADPTPVKYTVKDENGLESNQATVTVDYPQSNPVATDDEKLNQPLGTAVTLSVVDNDSDPENDLDPTTVKLVDPSGNPVTTLTVPNEGEWVVDPVTGAVTFTPENGFVADPTPVKYTVKDETGLESNQATVTIDYEAPAILVGTVWLDRDKDGLIDPEEQRMANWTLVIRDTNGDVVREVVTNEQGEYAVDDLIPAEYTVEFYNENDTLIATQKTNGPLSPSSPGSQPADLSLPIDPSGVIYNSVTRLPISGVTLQLLNATGTPVDPSCVGTGQQNQVTDVTGMYAFDVNPNAHATCGDPETYTINIVNVPASYYDSSAAIPPQSGVFNGAATEAACTSDAIAASGSCEVQAQPDAPTGNQPTTFYTQFTLASGNLNIIFNHIPLDPKGGGDLLISKVVDKHQASVGDMLYYSIDVANTKSLAVNDVDVVDDLPAGFQLATGSAKLTRAGVDGLLGTADDIKAVITPTGTDPMTFNDIDIAGDEKIRITYLLRVGASVIEGNHVNTAQALNDIGAPASNTAKATVIIVAEAVIDQSTLIGKVFHDRDGDGYQDSANATGITIKANNGFMKHLGGLTGRISTQDAISKHSKKVLLALGSDNSFVITTQQGTHIEVDHNGQVSESHKGMKAKGITGQDLRVTTRKVGKELEITVTNHGIHEEGIPGVRLATVTGLLIETDGHGRFHVPDVDGGRRGFGKNFILKVDKATLPKGAEFTTENPRVLRLTGAALNKINFGVKLPGQQAPARHIQQPAQYRTESRTHEVNGQQPTYQTVDVNLGSIFFDKDKYHIRADQRGIMDDIASKIERYGSGHITIDAFTDARHNAAYNIKLAERRANTVRGELQKRLGSKLMRNVKVDVDRGAYKEIPHNDKRAIDYSSNLLNGFFDD